MPYQLRGFKMYVGHARFTLAPAHDSTLPFFSFSFCLRERRYELLPSNYRFDALRAFVAEQEPVSAEDDGGGLERGYLVQPTRAVLKFIHNDDPDDKVGPKFEAIFKVLFSVSNFFSFFMLLLMFIHTGLVT